MKVDYDDVAKRYCRRQVDPGWLYKLKINEEIGFGVFTNRGIEQGEFIIEYAGELISFEEGQKRFNKYDDACGSFLFFYEGLCIDATYANQLGKYINDSTVPNAKIVAKTFDNKTRLCIFATRSIEENEEIRYSYGRSSDENFWWRNKEYVKSHPLSKFPCKKSDINEKEPDNQMVSGPKHKNVINEKNDREIPNTELNSESNSNEMIPMHEVSNETKETEDRHEVSITEPDNQMVSGPKHKNLINEKNDREIPNTELNSESNSNEMIPMHGVSNETKETEDRHEVSITNDPVNDSAIGGDIPDVVDTSDDETELSPIPLMKSTNQRTSGGKRLRRNLIKVSYEEKILSSDDSSIGGDDPDDSEFELPSDDDVSDSSHDETDESENDFAVVESARHSTQGKMSSKKENKKLQKAPISKKSTFLEKNHPTSQSFEKKTVLAEDTENGVGSSEIEGEKECITVMLSKSTSEKRSWEKKYPCLYCPKHYPKPARHLEDVHNSIVEVAEACAIQYVKGEPKEERDLKKKQRGLIFEKLQKKGCFQHNVEVLKLGKGQLVPEKCPKVERDYKDYLFCEFCLGLYFKTDLSRHVSKCHFLPEGRVTQPGQSIQGIASMLIPTKAVPGEALKKIFSRMLLDDVSLCIRNDRLIVKYGNNLCHKHMNNGNQNNHISNKLRELGRFLLAVRKLNPNINSLSDVINPKHFNNVIEAVVNLCGWDGQLNTISTPSLGIKLGHSLKKVAGIFKCDAMMEDSESNITLADRFQYLVSFRWNDEIAKQSRIELENRKWNKPKLLPFTSDLKILKIHLSTISSSSLDALAADNSNCKAWRDLATATLAWLILFNRRRGGEPAALEVSDFVANENNTNHVNEEVLKSLSPFEKKICDNYTCIEIRGKRGRKVLVMFSKFAKRAINLLIQLRHNVGVCKSNKYVFAVPNGDSEFYIRGCDALRKHVNLCELAHPEAICSTNLRKHVATLSQLLNLEDREVENLARYLGHDIRVHNEYYRLPENVLMVAKCGKMLVALENGMGNFTGKTLNEIDVSLDVIEEEENVNNQVVDENEKTSEATSLESATDAAGMSGERNQSDNDMDMSDDNLAPNNAKKKKGKGIRVTWTVEEKAAINQHFDVFLRSGKAPRQGDVEPILKREPRLSKRTWRDVKNFIHNKHVAEKRRIKKQQ